MNTSTLKASLVGYHPTNLCYQLVYDKHFTGEHPLDPSGSDEAVVGVHNIISTLPWEANPDGDFSGELLYHEVPLSAWTGTRAEFAAASEPVKHTALAVGPGYNQGRWGTHMGATMSVLTVDGYTVLRSREGKYAEQHLYDSILAGTMKMVDVPDYEQPNTLDYLRSLLFETNLSFSRDVDQFHPTHLAMRTTDFGLWLGGWFRVGLTADQVAREVPFDTLVVRPDEVNGVPLTDWAEFDLSAMRTHMAGETLLAPRWVP